MLVVLSPITCRYDDHKVLRFTPHSTSDVAKLHELFVRSQNSATANTTLDFWQPPSREQLPVDVRCSTQLGQCSMLENFSAENEIELHTLIDNLQPLIDDEVQHMGESRAEWYPPLMAYLVPIAVISCHFLDSCEHPNPLIQAMLLPYCLSLIICIR